MAKSILLLLSFIILQSFITKRPHWVLKDRAIIYGNRDAVHQSKSKVPVPHLIGLPLSEAMQILKKRKLNVGLIIADEQIKNFCITELIVYLHNPKEKRENGLQNYFNKGDDIDLWVTDNASKIGRSGRDTLIK